MIQSIEYSIDSTKNNLITSICLIFNAIEIERKLNVTMILIVRIMFFDKF